MMHGNLTASLGTPIVPKGRMGERFDCGDGRMWTAREIALQTGCELSTIYARIPNGWTGVDLLRGLRQKLFDCGDETLTIKQIMERTGLGETAVRNRLARGVRGRALLRKERKNLAAPRSATMVIACRLADAYPHRLPTTKEIRALYPMEPATAERWLAALRAARARA